MKLTIPLISFATAILLASGCTTLADKVVDPIKVKVPDVSISKVTASTAVLNVVLRVTNPNNLSATVNKLTYDIVISEKSVASGTYKNEVKIPANDTIETSVPITVTNKDILGFLVKVLTTKGAPFRAHGKVDVGPLEVPFDEKGLITSKDL